MRKQHHNKQTIVWTRLNWWMQAVCVSSSDVPLMITWLLEFFGLEGLEL